MKLGEIARRAGCTLEGDAEIEISGVAGIEEAGPGEITFLSNPRYRPNLRETRASAVFLSPGSSAPPGCAVLRSTNPYLAFARAIECFYAPPQQPPGVHPSAVIDPGARLAADVRVGPNAVIEAAVSIGERTRVGPNATIQTNVRIGADCVIHANVVIREHVRIGDRVILQNGAVIGADGFGFAPKGDGSYHKIVQAGTVVLEDDVEIGANATVDRAAVGVTVIGRGTKLDNLVQVGHGCRIGEHTVVASQAAFAGSTRIGSRVMIGGQVGAAGHQTIGDGVVVAARSGIHGDIPPGAAVAGSPHMPLAVWRKVIAALPRLPGALRRLRRVERRLGLGGGGDREGE